MGADSKPLNVVCQEVFKPKIERVMSVWNGWSTLVPRHLGKLASATFSHMIDKKKSNTTLLKLFATSCLKRGRNSKCTFS